MSGKSFSICSFKYFLPPKTSLAPTYYALPQPPLPPARLSRPEQVRRFPRGRETPRFWRYSCLVCKREREEPFSLFRSCTHVLGVLSLFSLFCVLSVCLSLPHVSVCSLDVRMSSPTQPHNVPQACLGCNAQARARRRVFPA